MDSTQFIFFIPNKEGGFRPILEIRGAQQISEGVALPHAEYSRCALTPETVKLVHVHRFKGHVLSHPNSTTSQAVPGLCIRKARCTSSTCYHLVYPYPHGSLQVTCSSFGPNATQQYANPPISRRLAGLCSALGTGRARLFGLSSPCYMVGLTVNYTVFIGLTLDCCRLLASPTPR